MRKQISLVLMTICAAVLIVVALPGIAKAESLKKVDVSTKTVGASEPGTIKAKYNWGLYDLGYDYAKIQFGDSYYRKEVQLLDQSGTKVVKTTSATYLASFSVKKNKVYFVRFREVYSNGTKSAWSGKISFCTMKLGRKLKSGKKIRFKVPKVKGVKKFKIYMSTKLDSGYKKIKTLKPGKSFKVGKFRGKKFKFYKNYYYWPRAVLKNGWTVYCPKDGFQIKRVFK